MPLLHAKNSYSNHAISMYKKTLSQPNTFKWNSIIKAHVDAQHFDSALSTFSEMRLAGDRPDHYTLPLVIRAISCLPGHFNLGEAIHSLGIQMGFCNDVYFCNAMIDKYSKRECVVSARRVFDEMSDRDVVTWTSLIQGHVQSGNALEAFRLFSKMRLMGLDPNSVTLAVMLRACCIEKEAHAGMQLYGFAMKRGFESYELVQNSVLNMFSKACCSEEVEKLFILLDKKSVIPWNIVISGYSIAGDVAKVVHCFREMLLIESVPNHETLTIVASACAKSGCLLQGQQVHGYAEKTGKMDLILQASILDFYAECGELASLVRLFEEVQSESCIAWSVVIWGFVHNGLFKEAIALFQRMRSAGIECNADTLRGLVLAYTYLGALQLGKGVHGYIIKNKFWIKDKALETSILNMYVKCGSIVSARRCFDSMADKDTIAWSSMIEGYAAHGLGLEAMNMFVEMLEKGIRPNSITFLCLLTACSHSGMVTEGCEVFDCMTTKLKIEPEINHYTCMVDLFGRFGKLDEAVKVIKSMSVEPDGRIWGALLAACRTHSDEKLSNYAAQRLFELEPENMGYHVLLSNIHAGDDRWNETEKIRKSLSEKELRKRPGWSVIDVGSGFCMFLAGDRSNPLAVDVHGILECLTKQIEDARCI